MVENSQVFLIFTCSYDPLIGTRKHVFKKIVNGYVFILFGCVCRARTSTRDDHACACVWSCSIFRKNLFFLSKFLPKKSWKSIYLWVPFRCWRKDFWKILAVHCKTAPIFFLFVCSVLFLSFFAFSLILPLQVGTGSLLFFSKINNLNRNSWIYQRTTCPCSVKFKRKFSRSAVLFFRLGDRLRIG